MSAVSAPALLLRSPVAADRGAVEAITRAVGLFHDDEVPVALEVLDGAIAGDPSYTALVAEAGDVVAGWICWGPTPCTSGTFDLYWLAVDPAHYGGGIGRQLVREMEHRLGGVARLIVVETAGRAEYEGTRAFYEAVGYRRTAVIPDFYAPGDDQVVYTKSLTPIAARLEGR